MSEKQKEDFKNAVNVVIKYMNDNPEFFDPYSKIEINLSEAKSYSHQETHENFEFLYD